MEIPLIKPDNNEQLMAVKAVLKTLTIDFVALRGQEYDAAFLKKIQASWKQVKDERVTGINPDNLWK